MVDHLFELIHEMPNDVSTGVLPRNGLVADGAHVADAHFDRFGFHLALPLLHELFVEQKLVQLGVDQRNVSGNLLWRLGSGR